MAVAPSGQHPHPQPHAGAPGRGGDGKRARGRPTTFHYPSNEGMSIYDAAMALQGKKGVPPLVVFFCRRSNTATAPRATGGGLVFGGGGWGGRPRAPILLGVPRPVIAQELRAHPPLEPGRHGGVVPFVMRRGRVLGPLAPAPQGVTRPSTIEGLGHDPPAPGRMTAKESPTPTAARKDVTVGIGRIDTLDRTRFTSKNGGPSCKIRAGATPGGLSRPHHKRHAKKAPVGSPGAPLFAFRSMRASLCGWLRLAEKSRGCGAIPAAKGQTIAKEATEKGGAKKSARSRSARPRSPIHPPLPRRRHQEMPEIAHGRARCRDPRPGPRPGWLPGRPEQRRLDHGWSMQGGRQWPWRRPATQRISGGKPRRRHAQGGTIRCWTTRKAGPTADRQPPAICRRPTNRISAHGRPKKAAKPHPGRGDLSPPSFLLLKIKGGPSRSRNGSLPAKHHGTEAQSAGSKIDQAGFGTAGAKRLLRESLDGGGRLPSMNGWRAKTRQQRARSRE